MFWLVGVCCESQPGLESGKLKANIMEGYLCAALLQGIFFVWPTEKAKYSIKLRPGAFVATHQQFALKPDYPNNLSIIKAYATNYARVWHVCFCFMLLVALLNSSSLVPVDMERGVCNDDPKLEQKSMSNKLKKKNYKLINNTVKYNMMLLHKATILSEKGL